MYQVLVSSKVVHLPSLLKIPYLPLLAAQWWYQEKELWYQPLSDLCPMMVSAIFKCPVMISTTINCPDIFSSFEDSADLQKCLLFAGFFWTLQSVLFEHPVCCVRSFLRYTLHTMKNAYCLGPWCPTPDDIKDKLSYYFFQFFVGACWPLSAT